jgi:tetratricopeptide (TPR) repeat protein/tRNA A-37 threonylcarbamoyl transferase component Bud32
VKATDRLSDVAAAVSDGAVVDWGRTESEAQPADRHLVSHLRILERVASVHAARPPIAAFERSLHDSLSHSASVQSAPPADTPNTWGPLTIVERIGSGTYADVYRARDPRVDRLVALKLLRHRDGGTAGESEAIEEARLLARVRHPNVVTVYGAERIDGRVGIWMELVDGRTLEQDLQQKGPFSADELVGVGTALCRALGAVHAAGLLHRDVKAQNVMRDRDGRVLLTDFGTGRDLANPGAPRELAGTPLYLAPEVLNGHAASAASDVYSLGVLLHHLATGSFPVSGRSLRDLRDAYARRACVPLEKTRPDLPRQLTQTIDRAVAVDVARRYRSAVAFHRALTGPADRRASWRPTHVAAGVFSVTLVAFSAAYIAGHRPSKAATVFQARDWVLVTAFDNRTGDDQFTGTLDPALTYELSNSTYVNVVPRERVDDALRLAGRPTGTVVDAAVGQEVAERDGGVRAVVEGAIERRNGGYAVTARIVDPRDGASLAIDREDAPAAVDVSGAVRRVSNWIRVRLGEAPVTVQQDSARLERVTTPSLRALRVYSEGLRAGDLLRFSEEEALLGSALAEDPTFASAYMAMAWALENQGRPRDTYIADARRAVDLIDTTTERERYWILGTYDMLTKQDQQAIGQFEALARRYPDDAAALHNLVYLYASAGRRENAADLLVKIADARPNNFDARVHAAQEVLRTRGLDAARPQAARAMRLLPTTPDTVSGGMSTKGWLLLFPVHELWAQRQGQKAATALDAVWARPEVQADWMLNILGKLRLALGQVRLAESVYSRITDPGERALDLAEVALARGDRQAVVRHLSAYGGTDLFAVSLLVRAGDLDSAERVLRRISASYFNPTVDPWALAEIMEARGDKRSVTEALEANLPWTRAMSGGAKVYLYAETLARAAVAAGDAAGAIRVLEEAGALGEKAYTPATQSGFYWMRTQKLLADAYRQTGQIDSARVVEHNLLATLAAADDDYPVLVELKARTGG